MENEKMVGIWIRVSTEDQARGESPEVHEKRARHYAEAKGWAVCEVYHLEAVSGKSVMSHPESARMLSDVRSGRITGLIFSKLARLARNTRELLDFADIFREYDADLVSLQEAIDTSTPAGRLFYTMIAAMAQWEREEIASRVAASVPVRAKMGRQLGGQASFGYEWKDGTLVINPNEAHVRRLLYETFLVHRRKKATARELNEKGYRTRNGSEFSDTTVDRLIRDTTAKGIHRSNYTRSTGEGRKWDYKSEEDWVLNPCPAIVDEAVWDECNRILDEQLKGNRRNGPKAAHLLSGFVQCQCGNRMYVYHSNRVYACRACKNRISAADLDEIYHQQLKTFLISDKDHEESVAKVRSMIVERQSALSAAREEISELGGRSDELLRMRLDGELSKESFARHHEPIETRIDLAQKRAAVLEDEISLLTSRSRTAEKITSNARSLHDTWESIGPGERRKIVETITERIVVGADEITISLSYVPVLSEMGEKGNESLPLWLL